MKKFIYIIYYGIYLSVLIIVSALISQSCKEEFLYDEITWKQTTKVGVSASDSSKSFIVGLDPTTNAPKEMILEELEINFDIDWVANDANPVKEIILFVQVQEMLGENKVSYGHDKEVQLAVITDFTEDGKFDFKLKAADLYSLFKDDFDKSKDRTNTPVLPDDLYEVTWKLKGADGTISDVRNDCFDGNCRYSIDVIAQSLYFYQWDGTFDYEWLKVGASTLIISHTS